MSEQLFQIAFSGQIADQADLETVKLHIGRIFKADAARLEQLFSGQRVIIKRGVDAAVAAKYRGAFEKVGAICEVVALGQPAVQTSVQEPVADPQPAQATAQSAAAENYVSRYPESEQIPPALLTEPLGVTGNEIPDLAADVAPVGSMMQHQFRDDPQPDIDISGFDVAPVGSILKTSVDQEPPPPPDTSGLALED
jgi:hypothetical protein